MDKATLADGKLYDAILPQDVPALMDVLRAAEACRQQSYWFPSRRDLEKRLDALPDYIKEMIDG